MHVFLYFRENRAELLSGYLYLFCAQLCTVCDSQELFERKLVVNYFVLYYSRKSSSEEGLILKFILLHMVINFDIIGFLDFTHALK